MIIKSGVNLYIFMKHYVYDDQIQAIALLIILACIISDHQH